jgi:hypothetical protein
LEPQMSQGNTISDMCTPSWTQQNSIYCQWQKWCITMYTLNHEAWCILLLQRPRQSKTVTLQATMHKAAICPNTLVLTSHY